MATATESPVKRQKLSGPLIGTHSGHFHADEALAVYLLRMLPTYRDSPLVRTRDPAVLATCHTVVDVGGEYSPSANRYDHHQRSFDATFPGRGTKLSSAGLVYLHFGRDIIAAATGSAVDEEDVRLLWEKLYDDLIEAFDANDNGIDVYDVDALRAAGVARRFEDRGFSVASVVRRLNYRHRLDGGGNNNKQDGAETEEGKGEQSAEERQADEDARFERASTFAGEQFAAELADKHAAWLPARAKVREAYADRRRWHPSGSVLVLREGLPWTDHLYACEAEDEAAQKKAAGAGRVLYVLFPESDQADSKWRVRAVSEEDGGFKNRKDLPDAWKGVRDEELSGVSGIEGCIFVHASGFIGGNKTFEGALEMAKKAADM